MIEEDGPAGNIKNATVGVIVVLGAWSSGSTALTGYVTRLGVYSCPPHSRTNDPATPDSHEPEELRSIIAEVIGNGAPETSSIDRRKFLERFAKWISLEKKKAAELGYDQLILKHPLLCYLIPEIDRVCKPSWIVITRNLEGIERTRLRRKWPPQYGKGGAKLIYGKIFNNLLSRPIAAMCINFDEFRFNATERRRLGTYLCVAPTQAQLDSAERWLRN